jgi:RNA polymerase sigma-70 factor (sigma-E family)
MVEQICAVEGIDALFRREGSALLGMMVAFLGDRAQAEDIVQEAFARVQRAWPRVDPDKAPAYLRSTAFNLARSGLRRGVVAARYRPLREAGGPTSDDRVVLADDQRAVIEALRRLPVRQRECLTLRYYAELSEREIGQTLGISPNSVKTHLRRGMAALGRELESRR